LREVAEPGDIRDGDIVQVHRIQLYYALVERAGARDVVIQPLNPKIADRRVRVEEIKRVFRDVGSPGRGPARLLPSPRQLRFDDLHGQGGGTR
jgi:hypothetical protein